MNGQFPNFKPYKIAIVWRGDRDGTTNRNRRKTTAFIVSLKSWRHLASRPSRRFLTRTLSTRCASGMVVPPAMGSANAINFQPTGGGKAAITGDFVLIASEVNPVLKALRDHGIEVTAIHNHMLDDQPRLYFMHFWANDDAVKLAQGLKAALAQINIAKS